MSASPKKGGNSKGGTQQSVPQTEVTSPVKDETMEVKETNSNVEDQSTETEDLTNDQLASIESEVTQRDEDGNVIEASGSGASYAQAARPKQPKDYLFCLYIQEGEEKRNPISKAHFLAFEREIWQKRISNPEISEAIVIDWLCWRHGIGIVAAADEPSANWVKTIVSFANKKQTVKPTIKCFFF